MVAAEVAMTVSPESLPGVGRTAIGAAAIRALESRRPDRLFEDPYAQAFVEAGQALVPELPGSTENAHTSALTGIGALGVVLRPRGRA